MPSRNSFVVIAVSLIIVLMIGVYAGHLKGANQSKSEIAALKIEVANLKNVNKADASRAKLQKERAKDLEYQRDAFLSKCQRLEQVLNIVYKSTIAIERASPSKTLHISSSHR